MRLELHGGTDLEAALAALGKDVATRTGQRAVRNSSTALREELVATAPFRPGRRMRPGGADYGHLRDNLKVRKVRAKKPGLVLYRVSTGDAFWGNFLEFGTVNMAARPWMRPTVDRMKGKLVEIMFDTLKRGIERAAKRLVKRPAAGGVLPNGRNG